MDSETGMLQECQHIYSSYLNRGEHKSSNPELVTDIDHLLAKLKPIIKQKSEEGANTVFLEKIESDLLFIRKELVD